ncbi:siphovirus ReqiPepy6 Gp37-like family protein [Suilimivivens sp.]|uniref:siphovirus ReqiPepy6 Gp37-like family protein n=1 Tax=Suilimivivens sp. TaxID=2981669 RepID=UPI00307B08E0
MNLALMDKDFNIVKYISFINLQWIRRYYEPGEFNVQLPASEYDSSAVYLFTKDRPEVGLIQKRQYADGYDGKVMQLSGYFYEYKLNDKITYPRFNASGNIEAVARTIISTYKEDIPILQLGKANDPLLGSSITKESTGDGLAAVIYELLQTQELSIRCLYDYVNNSMSAVVWQGKDRTQDQDVNSFVVFSEGFRNMQNEEIIIDNSNFKNYAVVIGNGRYEEGNQIEVIVDLRSNKNVYAQKLYVDQTGQTYDETKQTLDEFKEQLCQAGIEELAKYTDITSVSFDTIDRGLTYMKDYDLGDKCDVVLDSIGESYTVRIIEVTEVFKENKHTISLQFGNKVPTVYNKARR